MNFLVLFGWVAALLTIVCALPQFVKAFKTKSTDDISMSMMLLCVLNLLLWLGYGIYLVDWPLIIGDSIPAAIWIGTVILKLKYDKKQ